MHSLDRVLVTGATGFVGSTFVSHLLDTTDSFVVGLDTFATRRNPSTIDRNLQSSRYHFLSGDISDSDLIGRVLREFAITSIVNFAAESSVDRSIGDPLRFIENNVLGTARLLDKAAGYWDSLLAPARKVFRFIQSSTIEVYGSRDGSGPFTEETACAPNSPYAASKAASDNVARAYYQTYGMPTILARSATNYGPFQALERLIPWTTCNALNLRPIFVYGDGMNERDWIHVDDQCRGIQRIIEHGQIGRTYNLGSDSGRTNIEVVKAICSLVDKYRPHQTRRESLVSFVDDRPGHDRNQAMDSGLARGDLRWTPQVSFEAGLRRTVRWYIDQTEQGAFEADDSRMADDHVERLAASLSAP